ncbi:MAG: hypothetical protein KatS3mg105_4111 [Gemmatales bacterium]|nr:MAG: hypothetical protein KatS3mg105_4111 [Gemmatales bacterium]
MLDTSNSVFCRQDRRWASARQCREDDDGVKSQSTPAEKTQAGCQATFADFAFGPYFFSGYNREVIWPTSRLQI